MTAFIATVAHNCLSLNDLLQIICQKSDKNCGTQYKSQYVLGEYQKIAIQYDRNTLLWSVWSP